MGYKPNPDIVARYMASVGRVHRRVEVFEADGMTPWSRYDGDLGYLIEGSVSVDSTRSERRTLDVTLDNQSGLFNPTPGQFWYDKIIKVYRGLQINEEARPPSIAVIEDVDAQWINIRSMLSRAGYTNVRYFVNATTLSDVMQYDILIFNSGQTSAPTKAALAVQAYNAGISIITMAGNASSSDYPLIFGATRDTMNMAQAPILRGTDMPELVGWPSYLWVGSGTAYAPGGSLPAGAKRFAVKSQASPYSAMGVARADTGGKRWVHITNAGGQTMTGFQIMYAAAATWVNPNKAIGTYEIQIGEFMIDTIAEDNFPALTKITGRDYSKKLMLSTMPAATQFAATTLARVAIRTLALNAGISADRMIMPNDGSTLGSKILFERGTTRWDAIKQIADANSWDVYFDNKGSMVVAPYNDPTTMQPIFAFKTGADGSLVKYTRSANDTSLFNHIVVAGESSDSTTVPVWSEARNDVVGSPTSIAKLGDRVYTYTSPLMKTTAQCLDLAKKYLKIYSLEEYEMNWEAIVLDWLEAGDIVDVVPKGSEGNTPTRFLLSSFTLPLNLGTMTGSGRRMLIVK